MRRSLQRDIVGKARRNRGKMSGSRIDIQYKSEEMRVSRTNPQPAKQKTQENNSQVQQQMVRTIHSVETVKGLFLIKRKLASKPAIELDHKENTQTKAPVAFPHRP